MCVCRPSIDWFQGVCDSSVGQSSHQVLMGCWCVCVCLGRRGAHLLTAQRLESAQHHQHAAAQHNRLTGWGLCA